MMKDKEELSMNMLEQLSGGIYDVDESMPGVQELIRMAIFHRKMALERGEDPSSLFNQSRFKSASSGIVYAYNLPDEYAIRIYLRYAVDGVAFAG